MYCKRRSRAWGLGRSTWNTRTWCWENECHYGSCAALVFQTMTISSSRFSGVQPHAWRAMQGLTLLTLFDSNKRQSIYIHSSRIELSWANSYHVSACSSLNEYVLYSQLLVFRHRSLMNVYRMYSRPTLAQSCMFLCMLLVCGRTVDIY